MSDAQIGSVIEIGYQWTQRIQVQAASATFPVGCTLSSQVRTKRSDVAALGSLTIANGGLVRVSDSEIDIVISPAVTALMKPGTVVLDVIRTDLVPPRHLGFMLEIAVEQPVTRAG